MINATISILKKLMHTYIILLYAQSRDKCVKYDSNVELVFIITYVVL